MLLNNKNKKLIFVILSNLFFNFILSNQLDPTFGTAGVVVTSLGRLDLINSVTCQSDGKIIALGSTQTFAATKLAVARYTTAGVLDTTFNSTGVQRILIGSRTEGNSVAIQSNDKIVASGFCSNGQTDFALIRLDVNGALDTTFNGSGFTTMAIGSGASANSVKIQSDGKIIVAGTAVSGFPKFVLTNLTTTGTLNESFGTGGIVFTEIGFGSGINQIAIQADGKIVAAGYAYDGAMIKIALARYNSDGSLDSSFGSSGVVTTDVGIESRAQSVVIQDDGNIVVCGYTVDSGYKKFVTLRYDSSGSLDTTFGGTGIVITQVQYSDIAYSVAIQSDGKIISAGYSLGDDAQQFALVRYLSNGSLDTTFGTNGIELTTIGGVGSESGINSIFIQSDGKIVAAGFTNLDFALARYLS